MKLYCGAKELDIIVDDNSYRYQGIMEEHSLTIYFSISDFIEIPTGSYCMFGNEKYTLVQPASITQKGSRNYDYTLVMESEAYKLRLYKLRNIVDQRLKFSYMARPQEFLQLIVDNLNERDSDWKVGEYIDSPEMCVSFNHQFCRDALKAVADAFQTEYEIKGKTIHLRKVEYNKDNPLVLAYGYGKGFKTGIKRDNSDDFVPIEILYVQGGDKNIDASMYGSQELLLPKGQVLEYEGRKYITDSSGYSIRRADQELNTYSEDSLDCSHIYPSRVGAVSEVVVADSEKHFYDFIDSSIPESLDFEKYIIAGEKMTIIFQSGMLAGKEGFEVKYKHKERKFEIVPQELDGRTMPDDVYCPHVGDKYAVFGCMLPDSYICDNDTQTGASWDMFREAVKYKYEHEEFLFNFTGELDGIWSKKDWLNIGGKIIIGGYVKFTASFIPDGTLIRIKSVKEFLNNPYSPVIELSNTITGGGVSGDLRKIEQNEVVAEDNRKEAIQFAKRRFRDAQETMGMLQDSLLHFSGAINPITIQTMFMLVGDESLQFQFVNNKTNPLKVTHSETYNKETKIFSCAEGIIQHMTLGIDSMASRHDPSEYKFWDMTAYNSPVMAETSKKYYLYAKVLTNGTTGEFCLSETAIAMESEAGYYHLLMGIINSEYDGDRGYTPMYGFSEIAPGRMTIDRIVAPDASGYWDFVNKAFQLGDVLSFNTRGDGLLRLKGTIVQSLSGDEEVIGVFRGDYKNEVLYYLGDEVVYAGSTYRCKENCPTAGIMPINTTYWKVIAKKGDNGQPGADGVPGEPGKDGVTYYTWIRYADDSTGKGISNDPFGKLYIGFAYKKTTPTESNNPNDYQWSRFHGEDGTDGVPGEPGKDGVTYYTWIAYADNADGSGMYQIPTDNTKYIGIAVNQLTASESNNPADYTWSRFKGEDGQNGTDGTSGPVPVYKGVWKNTEQYFGNDDVVDIVYSGGKMNCFRAKQGVGAIPVGTPLTDTSYWVQMNYFENIATGLLLAELAYIENLGVRFLSTSASGKRVTIDGNNNNLLFYNVDGDCVIQIDTQDRSVDGKNSNWPIINLFKELSNNVQVQNLIDSFGFHSYEYTPGSVIIPKTYIRLYYDKNDSTGYLVVKDLPVLKGSKKPLYYNEATGQIGIGE